MKKKILIGGGVALVALFFLLKWQLDTQAIDVDSLQEVVASDFLWPSGPPLLVLKDLQVDFKKTTFVLDAGSLTQQPFSSDWHFRFVNHNALYAFTKKREMGRSELQTQIYRIDPKELLPFAFKRFGSRRLLDLYPNKDGSRVVVMSRIGETSSYEFCKLAFGDPERVGCQHRLTVTGENIKFAWDDQEMFALTSEKEGHINVYGSASELTSLSVDEQKEEYALWEARMNKDRAAKVPARSWRGYLLVDDMSGRTLFKAKSARAVIVGLDRVLLLVDGRLLAIDTKNRTKATILANPSLNASTILVGGVQGDTFIFN